MQIETNNFSIEYGENLDYIDDIVLTLENDTCNILKFFELNKLSQNKKVVIFTDREKYKNHLIPYVEEFKEWMCADTYDGNINLLDITEVRKSDEHKNMTFEEFIRCILHEFVHACQQEINPNSEGVEWYWEALATNLSGQTYGLVNLSDCDFDMLQKKFNNVKNAYSYSFALGKFMLENYSKKQLLEYVKNPLLLKLDANSIFQAARQSQNKNDSKITKM